jgi:hypothetical protein
MREDLEKRVQKVGRRAVEYRRMGFHCSESTFLAINETLDITGHICGALASGIVCIGFLYGRSSPNDDLSCVDELSFELHRRFLKNSEKKNALHCERNMFPSATTTLASIFMVRAQKLQ